MLKKARRQVRRWYQARERERGADLMRLAHRPGIVGVACGGRDDGGGAQVHGRISALVFSRASGLPFYYAPFSEVLFGESPEWVAGWENVIDFRSGFPELTDTIPQVTPQQGMRLLDWRKRVVVAHNFHAFCDRNPGAYDLVRDELRARCSLVSHKLDDVFAVHVRRGDVMADEKLAFRRTPLEQVAGIIEAQKRERPSLKVHVFSQGAESDFAALPDYCELHLDTDVFDALRTMVNADTLLMAKSCFSYIAGIIRTGPTLYDPFWHAPLQGWTTR